MGVTVIVAVWILELVLVAVKAGTLPEPLAGMAMDGLELVHV